MRLCHARRAGVLSDDPNLVPRVGLVPVMALADRCGLAGPLTERLIVAAMGGANATAKILALIAGSARRGRLHHRQGPRLVGHPVKS
jgi:hypothetical protein